MWNNLISGMFSGFRSLAVWNTNIKIVFSRTTLLLRKTSKIDSRIEVAEMLST